MISLSATACIDAPPQVVWKQLAELEGISRWAPSLESVRTALDASLADDRAVLLRATTLELGPTREAVLDAVTTRVELSRKQAADAYGLAERFETNPRSIWGYVQGLTRLSQRTSWQDHRFALDRAASRLLTTVH